MKPNNQLTNLKKNKYGFYQLANKPTDKYLQKFYSKKYYQNNNGNYKKNYSTSDKVNLFQKYELIFDSIKKKIFPFWTWDAEKVLH